MKKIALVRGSNLNKFEMQNYEPLVKHYDMSLVGTLHDNFETADINIPIIRLKSLYEKFNCFPLLRDIIASRYLGKRHLLGLEKILEAFDLVHIADVNPYSAQAALHKMKNPKMKMIVTVWENLPFAREDGIQFGMKQLIIEQADHFIAVTEGAKQSLLLDGAPERKISKILMGVDIAKFKPMAKNTELMKSIGISKDDFIILFPSRLEWEKGVFEALASFKRLSETSKTGKLKLLFVANGSESERLKKLAGRLGIQKDVIFSPRLSFKVMPDVHNLADIFIIQSIPGKNWSEQLGHVLVEALACGKPIVGTMSGAIPEVLGDAGLLVPPRDFYATFEALSQLLNDEKLRIALGNKARKRAEEIFDAEKVSLKIKEVYDKLLS